VRQIQNRYPAAGVANAEEVLEPSSTSDKTSRRGRSGHCRSTRRT